MLTIGGVVLTPKPVFRGLTIGAPSAQATTSPVVFPQAAPAAPVEKKKRAPAKPKEPKVEVYTGLPLLTEDVNDPTKVMAPTFPDPPVAPPPPRIYLPHNNRLLIITDSRVNEIQDTIGPIMAPAIQQGLGYQVAHIDAAGTKPLPGFYPGDTILLMGKTAYERVAAEWGALSKGKSVSFYRHTENAFNGAIILTTHSAWTATKEYNKLIDVQLDTQSAIRRAMTGTIAPLTGMGNYYWVDTFEPLCHMIQNEHARTGQPVRLSWDLECTGLDEHDPKAWIVSIFFSFRPGESFGMAFKWHLDQPVRADKAMFHGCNSAAWDAKVAVWEQINWLLNSEIIYGVGANLKFDKRWISKKWDMECTNHKFDTTLVGGLLNENVSNSLNNHCKIYAPELGGYDDYLNTTEDKGRMDLALAKDPEGFKVYAGGDTDACRRIYEPLRERLLGQPAVANLYINLLHPASDFFCRLEQVGVLVDNEAYAELEAELRSELKRLQDEADAMFPGRLRAKHKMDTSLTKAAVISDYMFSELGLRLKPLEFTAKSKNTAVPKPSTEYTHLAKFRNNPEVKKFLDIYKAYNSASKTLSTYVVGFLKHLRPDNRYHATYLLHKADKGGDTGEQGGGTVTGRLACTGPAMQTIPSKTFWAKKLRKCFKAPEGFKVVEIDYSQGELRVAAVVAGVRAMIDAYNRDDDLHVMAGALACGMDPATVLSWKDSPDPALQARYKFVRQNGKAANFGLLYAMQAEGYMNYARDTYGVDMTLDEAVFARNAFFELYPELLEWHDDYKRRAARDGYIISPLGRVRHLPYINSRDNSLRSQAERQAINSPIQSTLSDMTVLSGVEFERNYGRFGRDNPVQFMQMVHDALYCYIPEDDIDIWVPRIMDVMENLPLAEKFGWYNIPLKFKVEPEAGDNLASKTVLHWSDEHIAKVLGRAA